MRLVALLTVIVAGATSLADAAAAHGPCRCLKPSSGPPGTVVPFEGPAFKIVFNPDRPELPIGPRELWRAHDRAVAPIVVFRRSYRYSSRPQRAGASWKVPDVPPGRYLVTIYDGSEGGAHYTWDFFAVRSEDSRGADRTAADDDDEGVDTTVVAAVAGLALGFGTAIGRLVAHRRRRRR